MTAGGNGRHERSARGALAAQEPTAVVVALENGLWYSDGAFKPRVFYMVDGSLTDPGPRPPDSVIDLGGQYVIPPFADAHTHNLDGPFNLENVVGAYLREGTFYVSVLTNTASGAAAVRARFEGACSLDVIYANGGLTSTLSHPFLAYEPRAMGLYGDWEAHADSIRASRIREGDAYWFIDNRVDLDRQWPAILDGMPDLLKIFLLDAQENPPPINETGLPHGHGLRPSLVPEIVRRAHTANLRVAAHVETAGDFAVAVDGGVDILAHLPGYSWGVDGDGGLHPDQPQDPYVISDTLAARAAARGVVVTPTVSWAYSATGPDSARVVSRRLSLMRENLTTLREHGARLVVGSDWFGETAWHEIAAMRKLGAWTDAQLLEMWARETAKAIFPDRKLGVLESGYEASFLVLPSNPLEDLDATRSISMRVKQGCVLQEI